MTQKCHKNENNGKMSHLSFLAWLFSVRWLFYTIKQKDKDLIEGFVCFISLTTNLSFIGYLMLKFDTNDLHTVIWYQVFLSNINNLETII